MAAHVDACTPRIPQGINKEDPTRGTTNSPLEAILTNAGGRAEHDGWMRLSLRHQFPPHTRITTQALDHLIGQPLPVHISGRTIMATIVEARPHEQGHEAEFVVELPKGDETVAAFRRVVGVERLYLGQAAGGATYAELEAVLATNPPVPSPSDPGWRGLSDDDDARFALQVQGQQDDLVFWSTRPSVSDLELIVLVGRFATFLDHASQGSRVLPELLYQAALACRTEGPHSVVAVLDFTGVEHMSTEGADGVVGALWHRVMVWDATRLPRVGRVVRVHCRAMNDQVRRAAEKVLIRRGWTPT